MDIHLLRCTHGNECTRTHDVICDTFATIVQNVVLHMGCEQLHLIPLTTFNSFQWRVNIVFTKYGIHTLANVIIANPMWMDLFFQSYTT
jgi:hypothetical protein